MIFLFKRSNAVHLMSYRWSEIFSYRVASSILFYEWNKLSHSIAIDEAVDKDGEILNADLHKILQKKTEIVTLISTIQHAKNHLGQ